MSRAFGAFGRMTIALTDNNGVCPRWSAQTSMSMSSSSGHRCGGKSEWDEAILEAKKLLGYPNIFQPLQNLPSDGVLSVVGEIRKLLGTNHPLLKITKRLLYNGRNNMQTRGLIVMLMAKVAGKPIAVDRLEDVADAARWEEITASQRQLATITELVHTAHLIHKGVVNLSELVYDDGLFVEDMEFGNRIAILIGDYLLAQANLMLGTLRNAEVTYMISGSIRDYVEGEVFFEEDSRGNAVPSLATVMKDWEVRTYFLSSSLLANSCKSVMILAGFDEEPQTRAFEFGKLFGLAWKLSCELQHFVDDKRYPTGTPFELVSAPILLHLQRDPSVLELVRTRSVGRIQEPIDYKKIHAVVNGQDAIKESRDICQSYIDDAVHVLCKFPPSEARNALTNIVLALRA